MIIYLIHTIPFILNLMPLIDKYLFLIPKRPPTAHPQLLLLHLVKLIHLLRFNYLLNLAWMDKIQAFLDWFTANGGKMGAVYPADGVYAKNHIGIYQAILLVPNKLIINVEKVRKSYLSKIIQSGFKLFDPRSTDDSAFNILTLYVLA